MKTSTTFSVPEKKYMQRALELARYGAGFVSPNPMVGAVIVAPDGRIIGEGWHRKFGEGHAEVNAVASVRPEDEHLFGQSTIYVTLEPCSHYGKTPPCSLLLIEKGIGRVVVGSPDPFPLVSGRGIKMLREAGIEVVENFMRNECDALNRRFITAHTLGRPYILLKWAQSSDGFIAAINHDGTPRSIKLSNAATSVLMHSQRALYDAILVGSNTIIIDNPSLTTRLWPGGSPRPVTFRSPRIPEDATVFSRDCILIDSSIQTGNISLGLELNRLYSEYGITSLMVEGGASTLNSFIENNLFDEIRVEISPDIIGDGIYAPPIPTPCNLISSEKFGSTLILEYRKH
ncbi:MAG: bifunctional diaminohydroxyphosphoribosylaminopyrimidine deaminase/5-amino-6-(5-phosphoribosylamino)uracil reductase RibD [Bacteroidales bacterium]|nr:bifunctional diaminohydroxyphosphoribosylaminopyrimidine deaminase/5-amino-6-(5-phosphoribosylamino)uracil reductase RibD [Bacteroidales bacterium]